jgi:tRNA 2-thiocytidine biosynthesis protein TtcA
MNISIPKKPWKKNGKELESLCRKALFDFKMVENTESLAVALSGGKDSLTLLFMLANISGRGFSKFKIHAIHVEGEYSCGAGVDKDYLKTICEELGVNFITVKSSLKLENLECYSCSRERRKLIFNEAKKIGAFTVAFGHHLDDNVQTLMLNLLQKAEFKAMLPKIKMHKFGITIIRPLIYIREHDIKTFAKENDFIRIRCNCPKGSISNRKVVDNLLNHMEEFFPKTRSNLALSAMLYGSNKAENI